MRRENADAHSAVIVREGGRSSIPETAGMEPISRSVLDTPHARGTTAEIVEPPRTKSQQLRLLRRDRVVDADRAAGDHLGVDAAVCMAEPALQRRRDGEVALRGVR